MPLRLVNPEQCICLTLRSKQNHLSVGNNFCIAKLSGLRVILFRIPRLAFECTVSS